MVAKRITQLEKAIGAKLVMRSTRGLGLTAAGERYLPRFVRLVAEHDELFKGTKAENRRIEGMVRIQTPPTITSLFLGTILSTFQQQHPLVDMEVDPDGAFGEPARRRVRPLRGRMARVLPERGRRAALPL